MADTPTTKRRRASDPQAAMIAAVAAETARAIVAAVNRFRAEPLAKAPGVAETIEWAEAATRLNALGQAWPAAFRAAIGVVLKDHDDLTFLEPRLEALIG